MPNFSYEQFQEIISEIDSDFLTAHNQRYTKTHPYHLHKSINPCPFEGDLLKAKVVLLLANPHYKINEASENDHKRIEGWGIWGLSTQTHESLYGWWRPRLKQFINNVDDEDEWKDLSWKVASFQSVAWASVNFHECDHLPSKKLMADALQKLATKRTDIIFVVMRNKAYWMKILDGINAKIVFIKNPRCSFLTRKNMLNTSDWNILETSLKSSMRKF
jgi:hypothetical protein